MCLTLFQPHVKQSGAPVFKQPIVPPGLVIHFYHCQFGEGRRQSVAQGGGRLPKYATAQYP